MSMTNLQLLKYHFKQPAIFILLFFSMGLSQTVKAEIDWTGLYSGVQFSNSTLEVTSGSSTTSTGYGHVKAKLGKYLNERVSAEAQLGMTTNTGGSKGNLTYGGYARIHQDYGQYKIYGLLGLGGLYSYADGTDSLSESSFSYGVGVEIFGSKDLAL